MSTDPARDLTQDAFLGGRLHIWQPKTGYRAATDPVLLAASVPALPGQSVLELGCGAGTAALCLAARVPGLDLTGLELQSFYADLARRNAAENNLPLSVIEGDVTNMPTSLREITYDHVLVNPPFYEDAKTTGPANKSKNIAHREGAVGLSDWIDVGLKRLKPKGYFSIIHRTDRLGDILQALDARTGNIRVLPLTARVGRPAGRVIVQARKGARAPLELLPPFVLHKGKIHLKDGADYSKAAEEILRFGNKLDLSIYSARG